MAYVTYSDAAMTAAFIIGLLLIGLTIALFALVYWLRFSLMRRQRRQIRFLEVWAPVWRDCLNQEFPEEIPPLADSEMMLFLSVWLGYQESSEEGVREILNLVALRAGLTERLHTAATQGSVRSRMLALAALGFLKDADAWNWVAEISDSPNPFLSLSAARTLVALDAERGIPWVIERFGRRSDWPQARGVMILMEAGVERISEPLAAATLKASPDRMARLIPTLEIASLQVARQTVRILLAQKSEPETLAACLQLLPKLGGDADLEAIRNFLSHDDAKVRLAATGALGRLGGFGDASLLMGALNDPDVSVRQEAAQALAQLPGMQGESYQSLRNGLTDSQALCLLDRAMAERDVS